MILFSLQLLLLLWWLFSHSFIILCAVAALRNKFTLLLKLDFLAHISLLTSTCCQTNRVQFSVCLPTNAETTWYQPKQGSTRQTYGVQKKIQSFAQYVDVVCMPTPSPSFYWLRRKKTSSRFTFTYKTLITYRNIRCWCCFVEQWSQPLRCHHLQYIKQFVRNSKFWWVRFLYFWSQHTSSTQPEQTAETEASRDFIWCVALTLLLLVQSPLYHREHQASHDQFTAFIIRFLLLLCAHLVQNL